MTSPLLSATVTPPATASVLPSTSSSPATTPTTSSTDALGNASSDTFLKLLVAQLRYQDPMNPADPTQFMTQTAQFTEVEKLTAMDTTLTNDLATQQQTLAATLIGDQVTMGGGPNGTDVTGVVTGMQLSANGPLLTVNGQQLNINQLLSVQGPPGSTSNPSSSATTAA